MSIEAKDAAAAAHAVAPRVSLSNIEASIRFKHLCNGLELVPKDLLLSQNDAKALAGLTIAIIVMKNGFVFIGKSAPASPENFNKELGEKFAYQDALSQIWPYMGYALRDQLASKSEAQVQAQAQAQAQAETSNAEKN